MNIKFEDIFNLSISQFKLKWKRVLLNSIIFGLVMFVVAILMFVVVGISFIPALAAINGGLGVLAAVLAMVALAVFVVVMLLLSFASSVTNYVLADASYNGKELMTSFKSVCTKSNFSFYLTSVFLPLFAITVGVTILWVALFVATGVLAIIFFILTLIPYYIVVFYFSSLFKISLYKGVDVRKNSVTLLQTYTRKQIMGAYFTEFGLGFILGIVTSVMALIPILGTIAQLIIAGSGQVAITQAMIMRVRGEEPTNTFTPTIAQNKNVTLTSDSTKVTINSYGAQIKSVVNNDVEYMWQADPAYWGRTAPVLFPFVGKLKDDKFVAADKEITMNQHGFLRDREFTVKSQTANSVTFEYTSTLADFELYPCDFTVQISYQVVGRKVTTTYNVINNSSYQIPYQIGAHPAFNVESVNDLTLVFPTQEVTQHYFADGLQTSTKQVTIGEQQLSYDLINDNIPCYSDFSTKELILKNKGQDFLKFNFESMKYLAVWSPEYKNAKFICIEPWNGICSRADQVGYALENKDGMNYLAANASDSCSFSFEIC